MKVKFPALIVTTTDSVAGRDIAEYLSIVQGVAVHYPSLGDMLVSKSVSELCEEARNAACFRMITAAESLEADAVVAMRFDTGPYGENQAAVMAYGTAVKLK